LTRGGRVFVRNNCVSCVASADEDWVAGEARDRGGLSGPLRARVRPNDRAYPCHAILLVELRGAACLMRRC